MTTGPDEVAERLARWSARDAVIGLDAENAQLRAQLAEREREIAQVRERAGRLAQQVAQLTQERDVAVRAASPSSGALGRAYRVSRRLAGRTLRAAGLRR